VWVRTLSAEFFLQGSLFWVATEPSLIVRLTSEGDRDGLAILIVERRIG
jgi:hypothetical protein